MSGQSHPLLQLIHAPPKFMSPGQVGAAGGPGHVSAVLRSVARVAGVPQADGVAPAETLVGADVLR